MQQRTLEHASNGVDVIRAEYADSNAQVQERLVHNVTAN